MNKKRYEYLLSYIKQNTPDFDENRYGIFIKEDCTLDGEGIQYKFTKYHEYLCIIREVSKLYAPYYEPFIYKVESMIEVIIPHDLGGKKMITAYIVSKD